ncbi:MAG: agmatine deiminase [Candidatus Latescibacterota bacterium]|jgi:agmatine deiminase
MYISGHLKHSKLKSRYPIFLLTLFLALYTPTIFSQSTEVLPKGLTEVEKQLLSEYQFSRSQTGPPPTGPVRTMAEWEEVEYLVITWQPNFPNILTQIVAAAVNECKVIITTQNQNSVSSLLTSSGVDLANVSFIDVPWNSIWIRDYGGNTIYSDDVGERGMVDWVYNRPRPADDVMPLQHANFTSTPFYTTDSGTADLVNTGGNFMSDGLGNAFASELILNENAPGNPYGVTPKTEAEIDQIMEDYMGIETYIKMAPLPFDVINHIDMHLKLLDEETLLVSQYPEGVADGPQIEANINYVLNNFQSPFGTPYKIKWIPAPPSSGGNYPDNGGYYRNYTNSIFINKTILLPLYRPEVDAAALAQWEEMMPGYNIVGIDVDNPGENLISLVGAIHCITHTIGVEEPLWIVHQPVPFADANTTVPIDAMIKHISGINQAKVFWREVGAANYNETPMTLVSGDDWTADLVFGTDPDAVEYYIWAEATSGKSLTRPIVAPEGYWTINTEILSVEDNVANKISALFPNPTNGNVFVNLTNAGQLNIEIFNALGQQLAFQTVANVNGTMELPLQDHWKGVLLITFSGEFGSVTKKVIKH